MLLHEEFRSHKFLGHPAIHGQFGRCGSALQSSFFQDINDSVHVFRVVRLGEE